jgi:hypothetical protein
MERFRALRDDALGRGYLELAVTYGWTLMRLGIEKIEQNAEALSRLSKK